VPCVTRTQHSVDDGHDLLVLDNASDTGEVLLVRW
jgi:hypothetical protein